MDSTLTWIFALVMASVALAVPVFLQRRADAKIAALMEDRSRILDRERALASQFMAEQRAHEAARGQLAAIEADREVARGQLAAIEADREVARGQLAAIELDRERLFAELDHRHRRIVDALTRIAASVEERETEIGRVATTTAEHVLSRYPDIIDPGLRSLGASLGALMSVHAYVALAVDKKAQIADGMLGNDAATLDVFAIKPGPGSGRRRARGEDDDQGDDVEPESPTPTTNPSPSA